MPRPVIEAFRGPAAIGHWRGELQHFLDLVASEGSFLDRPEAEVDETHLQIIPYVLLHQAGSYFTVTRLTTQGEARLHGKVSLGIGGHLNPEDGEPPFWGGIARELHEEMGLGFQREELSPLGLIWDDSNAVGRVHLGVAYRLEVPPAATVQIAEIDKMLGAWTTPAELATLYPRMETWSQRLYDHWIASGS